MKGFKKSDSNNSQTNKLDPNLSDPTKYDLEKKEWFGDTVYSIFYNSGGGHSILIQPFYLMKDEQFAKQVFKQILDRVKQGKGYDDIKNANIKYAKSWEKGRHEITPGN